MRLLNSFEAFLKTCQTWLVKKWQLKCFPSNFLSKSDSVALFYQIYFQNLVAGKAGIWSDLPYLKHTILPVPSKWMKNSNWKCCEHFLSKGSTKESLMYSYKSMTKLCNINQVFWEFVTIQWNNFKKTEKLSQTKLYDVEQLLYAFIK